MGKGVTDRYSEITNMLLRGVLGLSVLWIWPIFGSGFRFSHLKTAFFRFWCPALFAGFLPQFGHGPLQKRERTGKEYGCFPFV